MPSLEARPARQAGLRTAEEPGERRMTKADAFDRIADLVLGADFHSGTARRAAVGEVVRIVEAVTGRGVARPSAYLRGADRG